MSLATPIVATGPGALGGAGADAPAPLAAAPGITREPPSPLSLRFLGGAMALWAAMGVIESLKAYLTTRLENPGFPLLVAFGQNMPWWLLWGLATPCVFWLARRYSLTDAPRGRAVATHIVAGLAICLLHLWLTAVLFVPLIQRPDVAATMTVTRFAVRLVNNYILMDVLTYWMIVAVYYGAEYYQGMRRRELEATRLRAAVSEARLHALSMQLNPHFLFNTLNSVSGLIRRGDAQASLGMLATLGDLLRETLAAGASPTVPLRDELALLRLYLDIEAVRFRDRLRVEYDVDPAALDVAIPRLLLQPLAENAVKHGIARDPGGGTIRVTVRRHDGRLDIAIANRSASPAAPGQPGREGIGLANVRERLRELYGADGTLALDFPAEGGCDAHVRLPARSAA